MRPSSYATFVATPVLGVSTGLRSFTTLAVTAWFARLGKLPVQGSWASWIAHPAAVGALTVAAIGECIGDKLPSTPSRTAPLPLVGRLTLGGVAGAIVATVFRRPLAGGVALGCLGAAIGTYGGFYLRRGLTHDAGIKDLPVALAGDVTAVALAVRTLGSLTA